VKEMQEELGYRITKVQRLFELYVSPAAVMEKIVFFTCAYSPADKVSEGGGLKEEGEDIDVVETTLEEAAAMWARIMQHCVSPKGAALAPRQLRRG